jgi:hypothetical protein
VSGSPLGRKGNRAAKHSTIEIDPAALRRRVLVIELLWVIGSSATLSRSVYAEGLT